MHKLTLRDLDLTEKRVLLRVDFNTPLTPTHAIADDTRIRAALPTIEAILEKKGKIIIISHLGRPKGQPNSAFSLGPCADRLSQLLGQPVAKAADCASKKTLDQAFALKPKQILCLENLRFYPEEERPDPKSSFGKNLARLGEVYIDDAFGAAHRAHTSITTLPQFFPKKSGMGLLMEREISMLSKLISHPTPPFSLVLGGAKLSTKITLLKALLPKLDALFIGGGMAFTFLKAKNFRIGSSICDNALLAKAQAIIEACYKRNLPLYLPEDCLAVKKTKPDKNPRIIEINAGLEEDFQGMDIGPKTVARWKGALLKSATVFWNGPMGAFENPLFAKGTQAIATVVSQIPTTTIIGGGDSIAAIRDLHLEASFTHLSTGGGACLAFLEQGGSLPGIKALSNRT